MPPRPNTAASVKGNEVLHLPNQWARDSCAGLDEKDFLLEMVNQVHVQGGLSSGSVALPSCPADWVVPRTQNGDFLQYASAKLRRDPDVVMAAVKNKGYAMKYAGAELVEDPSFMMKIVHECSRTYKYAGIKAYEFSPLGNREPFYLSVP